ncbi:MAG: hypothetical protein AB8F74_21200 [Saprospiraceae bacterium]
MKIQLTFKLLLVCLISSTLFMTTSCKDDDTPDREAFLGTYNVNENCDSGNWTYAISVTESSNDEDAVVISNFGDYGVNVRATVSGESITFNDTQESITFSGSGNVSGSTLTIIYTASAAGNTDSCTKTCIKQ